jgi:hypothetical protein
MKSSVIKTSLAAIPAIFAASTASAQSYSWWYYYFGWGTYGGGGTSSRVPEIDASTGALAIAALGAGLMLAREVKRRRKS